VVRRDEDERRPRRIASPHFNGLADRELERRPLRDLVCDASLDLTHGVILAWVAAVDEPEPRPGPLGFS
jgi:hypothetical protein